MANCKRCHDTGGVLVHGGFCDCDKGRMKRDEIEVKPTTADQIEAERLYAEGWRQSSRRYSLLWRSPAPARAMDDMSFQEALAYMADRFPAQVSRLEESWKAGLKQSFTAALGGMEQGETTPGVIICLRKLHRAELERRIS